MTSSLASPLDHWPNDDLLMTGEGRANFALHHPGALPIFDWPELRALFAAHDPAAAKLRKQSRRNGMIAAVLGFLSLAVAACTAIQDDQTETARNLGLTAALLAVLSGAIGYTGVLSGRPKSRWLEHRFWTERMRQLHFQLIVNNLALAAEAMRDAAALGRWNALRRKALADFRFRLDHRMGLTLNDLRSDLAEAQPWLDGAWNRAPAVPPPSVELNEIHRCFERQRFGIQIAYCRLKLQPGFASPASRWRFARTLMECATVMVLLLTAVAGALLAFGFTLQHPAWLSLMMTAGVLTALVLATRAIADGLQLQNEADRYEWYRSAVEALQREFGSADACARAELLRAMERTSYQEMRRFMEAFWSARFVM